LPIIIVTVLPFSSFYPSSGFMKTETVGVCSRAQSAPSTGGGPSFRPFSPSRFANWENLTSPLPSFYFTEAGTIF
jgi:hypothetical protein